MDDPIYEHESQFWDQVVDWLLEAHGVDRDPGHLLDERDGQDRQD